MDIPFPPGTRPHRSTPLARFLPPLEHGTTTQALNELGDGEALLLDPFGTSPQLVREAAQAGYAVLVAAANPVIRFVMRHTLRPLAMSDLQSVLARLGSAHKNGSRLELFILDLYRSQCSRCGASIVADYFVWDRSLDEPVLKVYACQDCNHAGKDPTTEEDREHALSFARRRLHHALALDMVAPAGDRLRHFAESALNIYPERAMYALMAVMNKIEQIDFEPQEVEIAQALLLSALDSTNAMWGHPEGRLRPRQLAPSPRYREINLWRALERGLSDWSFPGDAIETSIWPDDGLPEPGTVAIYPGAARQLQQTLPPGDLGHIITAVPRPNQAFWTLSVLWSAWLWGRSSATPIRAALGRRRYEWTWHAGALSAVLTNLKAALPSGSRAIGLVTEADPGFVAATLAGFDRAGFALTGRALRSDSEQAIFTWQIEPEDQRPKPMEEPIEKRISLGISAVLHKRGEPSSYSVLHAAVWSDLAKERQVASLWPSDADQPLTKLTNELELALRNRALFRRLDHRSDIESGVFWLSDSSGAATPLADRVEIMVLEMLRKEQTLSEIEVDTRLCKKFQGMETPDRRLIRACLESYASLDANSGLWRLKAAEKAERRDADCGEIARQLSEIGDRLGFSTERNGKLTWKDQAGVVGYRFLVQTTATMAEAVAAQASLPLALVMPGGRAQLLVKRILWDTRIAAWLEKGGRVIKFRHVRRLASDTTLGRENLAQRLSFDPPERHDRQMPLL